MKRREFLKLVTAAVPVAMIPAVILAEPSIDTSKIKWYVHEDPMYANATRVVLEYKHGDINFVDAVIIDPGNATENDINIAKQHCLNFMEMHLRKRGL